MDILDKRRGAGWPAHCDFLNHMALSQGILIHVRTRGLKMRNLLPLCAPGGAVVLVLGSARWHISCAVSVLCMLAVDRTFRVFPVSTHDLPFA